MPTHELPAFLPTAKAGGFLRSIGDAQKFGCSISRNEQFFFRAASTLGLKHLLSLRSCLLSRLFFTAPCLFVLLTLSAQRCQNRFAFRNRQGKFDLKEPNKETFALGSRKLPRD